MCAAAFERALRPLLSAHHLALLVFASLVVAALTPELAAPLWSALLHAEFAALQVRGTQPLPLQVRVLTALLARFPAPLDMLCAAIQAQLTASPPPPRATLRFLLLAARAVLALPACPAALAASERACLVGLGVHALEQARAELSPAAHGFFAAFFSARPPEEWLFALPLYTRVALRTYPTCTSAADLSAALTAAVRALDTCAAR